jgi:hypothetical protein
LILKEVRLLAENKYKESHRITPVENHATAAWANIAGTKDMSEVPVPDELQVIHAKEYVDENHK